MSWFLFVCLSQFRDLPVSWSTLLRALQKSPGTRSPTVSLTMNGSASSPDGELRPDAIELQLLMRADARPDAEPPSAPAAPLTTTLTMIPMVDTSRLIMSVASAIHAPTLSNSYASGGGTRHSTLQFGAGADLENSLIGGAKLKESTDDSALFRHSLRNSREPRGALRPVAFLLRASNSAAASASNHSRMLRPLQVLSPHSLASRR